MRTEWGYSPIYGLVKTRYPNGRETHLAYQRDANNATGLFLWEYKDVVHEGNDPTCSLLSPVKITYLRSGQAVWIREVRLEGAVYPPRGTETYTSDRVIPNSRP